MSKLTMLTLADKQLHPMAQDANGVLYLRESAVDRLDLAITASASTRFPKGKSKNARATFRVAVPVEEPTSGNIIVGRAEISVTLPLNLPLAERNTLITLLRDYIANAEAVKQLTGVEGWY